MTPTEVFSDCKEVPGKNKDHSSVRLKPNECGVTLFKSSEIQIFHLTYRSLVVLLCSAYCCLRLWGRTIRNESIYLGFTKGGIRGRMGTGFYNCDPQKDEKSTWLHFLFLGGNKTGLWSQTGRFSPNSSIYKMWSCALVSSCLKWG